MGADYDQTNRSISHQVNTKQRDRENADQKNLYSLLCKLCSGVERKRHENEPSHIAYRKKELKLLHQNHVIQTQINSFVTIPAFLISPPNKKIPKRVNKQDLVPRSPIVPSTLLVSDLLVFYFCILNPFVQISQTRGYR